MATKEHTCMWCNRANKCKDYYINEAGFVCCPSCKEPLYDWFIQDDAHWSKTYKLKGSIE